MATNAEKVPVIVLQELRRRAKLSEDGFLPPIAALAKAFKIRSSVVAGALRQLEREGLIRIRRGRQTRILSTAARAGLQVTSGARFLSADRVAQAIRQKIESGTYAAGRVLPKREVLRLEFGVSQRTVGAALESMRHAGLIHRRGLRWFAGSAPGSGRGDRETPPMVVVLQPADSTWRGLESGAAAPFARAFVHEAEMSGVRLVACTLESRAQNSIAVAVGPGDAIDLLHRERQRILGVLGVEMDRVNADNRTAVMGACRSLHIPLVMLDRSGMQPPRIDRNIRRRICSFSEERLAAAVVAYLARRGHRAFGYIGFLPGVNSEELPGWVGKRFKLLESASVHTGLNAVSFIDRVAALAELSTPELGCLLEKAAEIAGSAAQRCAEYVRSVALQDFPGAGISRQIGWDQAAECLGASIRAVAAHQRAKETFAMAVEIIALCLDPSITALIAVRDRTAAVLLRRMRDLGISVPGQVSFLSIDNALPFSELPLTTVDPGSVGLGYRAFHAILGDVPVGVSRDGRIVAEPLIIDRGSVVNIRATSPA